MNYTVGDNVPIVFDTQPNITGLTDMRMSGSDIINDVDLTVSGQLLYELNVTVPTGIGLAATELTTIPGTYVYEVVGLPVGKYLFWMSSASSGAVSAKVLVNVSGTQTGDKFYGQVLA